MSNKLGNMVNKWEEMVVVGRVARAHGNRGRVIVNPETDFLEQRFQRGGKLLARRCHETRELQIADVRFQSGRPVIGFEGIITMDAADELADMELRIPATALSELPAGAYYQHDLVGCGVTTVSGRPVGMVAAVRGLHGAYRLIVMASVGEEIDIPLVDKICVQIDLSDRTIVIDPPNGLLELNHR